MTALRLFLLSLIFSAAWARAEAPPEAPFERLAHVDFFAFGGVGYGGVISQGEKDFFALLNGPTPQESFQRLLEIGNPQAKCYALVGLYRWDRASFDRYFILLKTNGTPVNILRGCISSTEPFGSIMQDIASNKWQWGVPTKEAAK